MEMLAGFILIFSCSCTAHVDVVSMQSKRQVQIILIGSSFAGLVAWSARGGSKSRIDSESGC